MDLFTKAASLGIQTEFIDGQGHRHVTDAAALKIILDALPAETPQQFLSQPVVIRSGKPSRTALSHAAKLPARWKIVADLKVIAEGKTEDGAIAWPVDLPVGTYWLHLCDASSVTEEATLMVAPSRAFGGDFDRCWLLGGPTLRRPVGTQLGDRGLHRSRRPDQACRRSGGWRGRPQSVARLVRRSSRRLQSLFAEQPAVSQRRSISMSRNWPAHRPRAATVSTDCKRSDVVDYAAVARLKWQALRSAFARFKAQRRPAARLRKISRRARAAAVAVRLLRGAAAQIQQAMVGMARTMAAA